MVRTPGTYEANKFVGIVGSNPTIRFFYSRSSIVTGLIRRYSSIYYFFFFAIGILVIFRVRFKKSNRMM